ncbi:HotDog domain-containing protein [Chytriomyces sp. MP71]|nr:HotDog domain-containing protein [Chytriomyces sp. MP71]
MPGFLQSIQSWLHKASKATHDESHDDVYYPSPEVVDEIESLPLVKRLVQKSAVFPFRPALVNLNDASIHDTEEYLKFPGGMAVAKESRTEDPAKWSHQLIRGPTLYGANKVEFCLQTFNESDQVLINIVKFGSDVVGHPHVVHGGLQGAFFDDSFGTIFMLYGKGEFTGVTANLNINYRSPMRAPAVVAFVLWVDKVEGRKVFLKAEARSIPTEQKTAAVDGDNEPESKSVGERLVGKGSVLFSEATALFIKLGKEQLEKMKGN